MLQRCEFLPTPTIARVPPRGIRFHDVRHTHASLLLKAGVPVKVVSERLGHATLLPAGSAPRHVAVESIGGAAGA
jgi:integrase